MSYHGVSLTQKTTYNVLLSLYESLTVGDVSLSDSTYKDGVFEWYKSGDCYWIKYNVDKDVRGYYIGNYQGKILYCDAPSSETTYTYVAIAGATGYCLTNRPAGTTGSDYLGDLRVTQDNLTTIHGVVDGLGSDADFYMVLRIVDGEYRYYIMCTYPNRTQYFVCNTSGQLYYALRDEVTDDGSTDSGSSFDATEVITAINSVYSAINSMSSNVGSRLATLINSTNGIGASVENLATNVVTGFTGVQEQLSTLSSYFSDLSGLFPVQEEITLLGSDTRVAWDAADRITDVKLSGFTDDLVVKEHAGDLVDESGYENVSLSDADTEYKLTTDDNGYRRIMARNEYPDTGSSIPDDALFYFPFDDSLSSVIGDFTFNLTSDSTGTVSYSAGVNGNAFFFNGKQVLLTPDYGDFVTFSNGSFTLSYWLYLTNYTTGQYSPYSFAFGSDKRLTCDIDIDGKVSYYYYYDSSSNLRVYGSHTFPLNTWVNIAMTYTGSKFYGFINGELDAVGDFPGFSGMKGTLRLAGGQFLSNGTKLDELIMINGRALWTSSFDAEREAVFSEIAKDYFLPCIAQNMTLVFDDTLSKTLTPADVNGDAITMGRLEDDFSEIYMDINTMQWYCHDPQTQTEIVLSSANQAILDDTIYIKQNYTMVTPDQITADAMQNLLPIDKSVYLDIPENAKITITYDHYSGWFRMMYLLMDKQTKLLSDLEIVNTTVNETIINVENTVVDITQDNDAFSIFYVEKTDGTSESVGETATDAAKVVGEFLSVFYRLIFADGLENADIIHDFEEVYTVTDSGVSVW